MASGARLAYLVSTIVVLLVRARNTLFSVEYRSACRAVHTFLHVQVIDLVCGTVQALKSIQVKVFREVAGDTAAASEELLPSALTLLAGLIVYFPEFARSTYPQRLVPIEGLGTGSTFGAIEERSLSRTVDTLALINIVDHVLGAGSTLFLLVVEVGRKVAVDAGGVIPESPF